MCCQSLALNPTLIPLPLRGRGIVLPRRFAMGPLSRLRERVGVREILSLHIRNIRSPRPMPDAPVRTVSRITPGSIAVRNASSLDPVPVSSIV